MMRTSSTSIRANWPVLLSSLLLALVTSVAHGDVYRYVDKDGTVKYTDKPELLPAELLAKIRSTRTDNSAVADRVAADLKARDDAAKSQSANEQAATEKKQADAAKEADKANRCLQARNRYASLNATGRVFSVDEKGERQYMDDKQLDQSRASAQKDMDTWCN